MSEWYAIYNWAVANGISAEDARKALEEYLAKKKAGG